jgi:hypothetical protein
VQRIKHKNLAESSAFHILSPERITLVKTARDPSRIGTRLVKQNIPKTASTKAVYLAQRSWPLAVQGPVQRPLSRCSDIESFFRFWGLCEGPLRGVKAIVLVPYIMNREKVRKSQWERVVSPFSLIALCAMIQRLQVLSDQQAERTQKEALFSLSDKAIPGRDGLVPEKENRIWVSPLLVGRS